MSGKEYDFLYPYILQKEKCNKSALVSLMIKETQCAYDEKMGHFSRSLIKYKQDEVQLSVCSFIVNQVRTKLANLSKARLNDMFDQVIEEKFSGKIHFERELRSLIARKSRLMAFLPTDQIRGFCLEEMGLRTVCGTVDKVKTINEYIVQNIEKSHSDARPRDNINKTVTWNDTVMFHELNETDTENREVNENVNLVNETKKPIEQESISIKVKKPLADITNLKVKEMVAKEGTKKEKVNFDKKKNNAKKERKIKRKFTEVKPGEPKIDLNTTPLDIGKENIAVSPISHPKQISSQETKRFGKPDNDNIDVDCFMQQSRTTSDSKMLKQSESLKSDVKFRKLRTRANAAANKSKDVPNTIVQNQDIEMAATPIVSQEIFSSVDLETGIDIYNEDSDIDSFMPHSRTPEDSQTLNPSKLKKSKPLKPKLKIRKLKTRVQTKSEKVTDEYWYKTVSEVTETSSNFSSPASTNDQENKAASNATIRQSDVINIIEDTDEFMPKSTLEEAATVSDITATENDKKQDESVNNVGLSILQSDVITIVEDTDELMLNSRLEEAGEVCNITGKPATEICIKQDEYVNNVNLEQNDVITIIEDTDELMLKSTLEKAAEVCDTTEKLATEIGKKRDQSAGVMMCGEESIVHVPAQTCDNVEETREAIMGIVLSSSSDEESDVLKDINMMITNFSNEEQHNNLKDKNVAMELGTETKVYRDDIQVEKTDNSKEILEKLTKDLESQSPSEQFRLQAQNINYDVESVMEICNTAEFTTFPVVYKGEGVISDPGIASKFPGKPIKNDNFQQLVLEMERFPLVSDVDELCDYRSYGLINEGTESHLKEVFCKTSNVGNKKSTLCGQGIISDNEEEQTKSRKQIEYGVNSDNEEEHTKFEKQIGHGIISPGYIKQKLSGHVIIPDSDEEIIATDQRVGEGIISPINTAYDSEVIVSSDDDEDSVARGVIRSGEGIISNEDISDEHMSLEDDSRYLDTDSEIEDNRNLNKLQNVSSQRFDKNIPHKTYSRKQNFMPQKMILQGQGIISDESDENEVPLSEQQRKKIQVPTVFPKGKTEKVKRKIVNYKGEKDLTIYKSQSSGGGSKAPSDIMLSAEKRRVVSSEEETEESDTETTDFHDIDSNEMLRERGEKRKTQTLGNQHFTRRVTRSRSEDIEIPTDELLQRMEEQLMN